ncbi:MAG: hypothetical protein ACLGI8_01495 [Acidimicrobiia bacterium]
MGTEGDEAGRGRAVGATLDLAADQERPWVLGIEPVASEQGDPRRPAVEPALGLERRIGGGLEERAEVVDEGVLGGVDAEVDQHVVTGLERPLGAVLAVPGPDGGAE